MFVPLRSSMSEDTWQEWSGAADEAFNLTMEDIEYLYTLSPLTFESYYQLRRLVTHRGFPAHPAEFLMPMTLKNLDIAACAALVEELRERRISGTLPETMFDMHRLVEDLEDVGDSPLLGRGRRLKDVPENETLVEFFKKEIWKTTHLFLSPEETFAKLIKVFYLFGG